MKLNLPTWANVALFFLVALLHALCVFDEWYTSIPILCLQGVVAGWLVAGFSYGVFAGKKAVEATKENLKNTKAYQDGGSTPASRAKGYWIWTFIIIAAAVAMPIAKVVLE